MAHAHSRFHTEYVRYLILALIIAVLAVGLLLINRKVASVTKTSVPGTSVQKMVPKGKYKNSADKLKVAPTPWRK